MRGGKAESASKNDPAFRHFVESQQTWDRAMAQGLATGRVSTRRGLAVGIVGMGHIRHGHGIPLQLRDLGVSSTGTLLPVSARSDCAQLKPGLADAAFMLPQAAATKPPPPRLGVRLELRDKAVRLAEVTKGSLAERSGLQTGDTVVSVAGRPLTRVGAFIDAVRRQPDGTWLPLEIRRGEDTREVLVKFPPKK
jgi:hypothetical protein